jgi:hypothetical protein
MNDTKGIIYLIQPAELVGTQRYKIGCSSKTTLDRCQNGYKKGSRFLNIMECLDPFGIEKELKRVFGSQFRLVAGKEYFEGDEEEIKKRFYEVVTGFSAGPVTPKPKRVSKNRIVPIEFTEPVKVKSCPHENMNISCNLRAYFDDLFQFNVYVKNDNVEMFKLTYDNKPCGYHSRISWFKPGYRKFYLDCIANFSQREFDIIKTYKKEKVGDFDRTDFEKQVKDCYEYVKREYEKNGVEPEDGCVNICLDETVFYIKICYDKSIRYIQGCGNCCDFPWG